MLVLWGGVIALVVWAVIVLSGPRPTGDKALEILRRRLAVGEIGQEEFEKTPETPSGIDRGIKLAGSERGSCDRRSALLCESRPLGLPAEAGQG